MATCEFALHLCPKGCRPHDGKKYTRKELEDHLASDCPYRDYECEHCGKRGTYAQITEGHDKVCSKKVVACSNADCTRTMKRCTLKRHLEYCEFTEIPCKYLQLGCGMRLPRLDMEVHEKEDRSHLRMSLDTVAKLESERQNMKEQMSKLEDKFQKSTFKVTGYNAKKGTDAMLDCSFFTTCGGYEIYPMVGFSHIDDDGNVHIHRRLEPTHIDISVCACPVNGDEASAVSWPFIGELHMTLLNQLENKDHYSQTIDVYLAQGGSLFSEPDFISLDELEDPDPNNSIQYLKDDTFYLRMSVEIADHKHWLECTKNTI